MVSKLISRTALEHLAGHKIFRRGEAYFAAGAVQHLDAADDKITAFIDGSETYQVELWDDDGNIACDCTCPHAADGNFCKHCVAVGLAWLATQNTPGQDVKNSVATQRHNPWCDIRKYLSQQPPENLIDLMLEVAQRDERLYQLLLLKTETNRESGDVATAFRRAIDDVTHVHGFVDWREAGAFASNLNQVVESLTELLQAESADLLVDLAEYAINKTETALLNIHDSDGEVSNIVYNLGELHFTACTMARPEPTALAERLFQMEMTLPLNLYSFDAITYRDVLSEIGLQQYRDLAEAEWDKIGVITSTESRDDNRYRITRIMEQLAMAYGTTEELVAIKSRDLSSGYRYLEIAELWAEAEHPDKALEWAERGLAAFPEQSNNRLRDFLVVSYLLRNRNDEAVQLTWVQFQERLCLEYYKKLQHVADKLGLWPEQRLRALELVANTTAQRAATTHPWKHKPAAANNSLRIEIALWEQDLDAAWIAAHEGACDRHLLITLAEALEPLRTNDAITLYRRVVPTIVEQTNNRAYEEAISLIHRIGGLMKKQNQPSPFGDYLDELQHQFKPKRNFIKLLHTLARPA